MFYHFLYKTVHVEAHLKFEKSSVAGGSRTGRYGSSKDNVWWNGVWVGGVWIWAWRGRLVGT